MPMTATPEEFIEEVKKFPPLWDKSDEDYKDKEKKYGIWRHIAVVVIHDFLKKSKIEQKIEVSDLMTKWRGIRDNYIRSRKKRMRTVKPGARRVRPYIYESQLLFLENCLNAIGNEGVSSKIITQIKDEPMNDMNEVHNESNSIADEVDIYVTNIVDNKITTTSKKPKKIDKINSEDENMLNYMEENEDLAFFMSILPTVRTLSPDEKLTFRMQTMQSLQTIKKTSIYSYPDLEGISDTSEPTSVQSFLSGFSVLEEKE